MDEEQSHDEAAGEVEWAGRRPKGPPLQTRLRDRRAAAGLTQKKLSKRAMVPLRTIQRLEAEAITAPPFDTLYRLAWVLDCSIGELVEPDWVAWPTRFGAPDAPDHAPPGL